MEYVKLGNTGLDVSPLCLGCMSFGTAEGWVHDKWALSEEDSRTIIKRALDLGINFFDMLMPLVPAKRFSGAH
jgi:aryl-alcohol dehydrogenase-like predicted oxidoreductase